MRRGAAAAAQGWCRIGAARPSAHTLLGALRAGSRRLNTETPQWQVSQCVDARIRQWCRPIGVPGGRVGAGRGRAAGAAVSQVNARARAPARRAGALGSPTDDLKLEPYHPHFQADTCTGPGNRPGATDRRAPRLPGLWLPDPAFTARVRRRAEAAAQSRPYTAAKPPSSANPRHRAARSQPSQGGPSPSLSATAQASWPLLVCRHQQRRPTMWQRLCSSGAQRVAPRAQRQRVLLRRTHRPHSAPGLTRHPPTPPPLTQGGVA